MNIVIQLALITGVAVIVAVLSLQIRKILVEVSQNTRSTLERRNVKISRDGVRLGVKSKSRQEVVDDARGVLYSGYQSATMKGLDNTWFGKGYGWASSSGQNDQGGNSAD